jgi:hypothetical protein
MVNGVKENNCFYAEKEIKSINALFGQEVELMNDERG